MTALLCPLCTESRFDTLEALQRRLVRAATQSIRCPICEELLLGLDKFTIHLFGHTLSSTETPAPPKPPPPAHQTPPSTVNMDDLSFLTSWENCWKSTEVLSQNKDQELLLEIQHEEPKQEKKPCTESICTQTNDEEEPKLYQTAASNLIQQYQENIEKFINPVLSYPGVSKPNNYYDNEPKSSLYDARNLSLQSSPSVDSPPAFLFDKDDTLLLSPEQKEVYEEEVIRKQSGEIRELSHCMEGLLKPKEKQTEKELRIIDLKSQILEVLKTQPTFAHFSNGDLETIASRLVLQASETAKEDTAETYPSTSTESWQTASTDQSYSKGRFSFIEQFLQQKNEVQSKEIKREDEFCCKECRKSFKMRGSLIVHLRVAHGGRGLETLQEEKNFRCTLCSKAFKKEQHLAQHMKTHDGKQWQCETCSKFFTTKYFLKKHQRLHTGEMPYCCETCGKTFTFQQSYHKHLLYHSSDKPHECKECGRAFKELSTLHNHQRIHSGEKPFACETCGKCFRQRVSYIVHQRIHTGVLPYQCTACCKKFRYKVSQRSHRCTAQPPGIVVRQPGDLIQRILEQRRLLECQD